MAGMSLLGAGAFLDGLDDMRDTFSGDSDGYRMGTAVEYADDQEFGTSAQPGTPHLRPGMDATKAQLPRISGKASGIDEWMRLVALRWEAETKSRAPVDTGNLRSSYTTEEL